MNGYEQGQFIAATWGVVNKQPRRVNFTFDSDHPDGYYLQGHTAFEKTLHKRILPLQKIPVKVVFVEAPKTVSDGRVDDGEHIVYTQSQPPPLDEILLAWEGEFEPTEDYVPPLA